MELTEYEQLQPHAELDGITFMTPNMHCAWRVESLYTKEPDTIAWIQSMQPNEVLYDVGANMGQYSLFAAHRGIKVFAFEPEAQNFALLCKNVAVNKMSDRITGFPLALAEKPGISELHLSTMKAGGSCHAFDQAIDFHGTPKTFPYIQGSVATTIDIFASKYAKPDHIKIDVDGFEHLVIEGGKWTLGTTKSVLIEINRNYPAHVDLVKYMIAAGFTYDEATAESARRKEGPFTNVGNIIFVRP
jgi:FkbM family methyltransferase